MGCCCSTHSASAAERSRLLSSEEILTECDSEGPYTTRSFEQQDQGFPVKHGGSDPSWCRRICGCCCMTFTILLVLVIVLIVVLSQLPVEMLPKEVQVLLSSGAGYGSWTNLLLGINGVVDDSLEACPAHRGVQENIPPQCIVDLAKFQLAQINSGKKRLPLVCGINAFDPRRLNKQWCDEAGLKFDNAGGPDAPCGTMVFGTAANLPTTEVDGGAAAIVDLTGLFWMNNNTATEHIGEQLFTFAGSTSEQLSQEEITFFRERDLGLLRFKGITQDVPDFKITLNPKNPDERWSYDDRCISSNGIMRLESSLNANDFTFYFWKNSGTPGGPVYAEIDLHDWAKETVWTFEVQAMGGVLKPGGAAFRGIYSARSTEPDGHSYLVLKVLTDGGQAVTTEDGTDNWNKFLGFLESKCITSLFTWKNNCQCKRYCGLKQLNTVQDGCQSFVMRSGLDYSPTQQQANLTAVDCCQCTECA
eukprot:TRINITY_DN22242_c0_g1_i1.p1 TRINITY_DN22242_c0_g1~~TRINITY_DN22242_c0_g1_i1.p1  ORF type:complete len:475 (+),score=72.83 TRINITY_DN22242_c0_g1_i1:85-1509(+)